MSSEIHTLIRLENVDILQRGIPVLTDLNFQVEKGEFCYLIGKTGMGKSSLLRTLYADIPLGSGEAEVAGYNLKNLKPKDVPFFRRKLGIVFQDFQLLLDRNIRKNLEFVLRATGWTQKSEMEERIDEVLTMVDLKTKDFKMPYEVSGGEQQRLGIARALLNDPELILADEPTGNLDPETSQEILQLMKNINAKGTSILMATHDYLLIEKNPSRLLKIESGKVLDLGRLLF